MLILISQCEYADADADDNADDDTDDDESNN
jgi:hypothetical protein